MRVPVYPETVPMGFGLAGMDVGVKLWAARMHAKAGDGKTVAGAGAPAQLWRAAPHASDSSRLFQGSSYSGFCSIALPLSGLQRYPPPFSPSELSRSEQPSGTGAGRRVSTGRSAPTQKATIFTGHYLVVEVAVYPARGQIVTVKPSEMRSVHQRCKDRADPAIWIGRCREHEMVRLRA